MRPWSRANGEEDASPGQRPGDHGELTFPPWKGGRALRPFRAFQNSRVAKPRALPWA